MIKRALFVGFIVGASVVSFKIGRQNGKPVLTVTTSQVEACADYGDGWCECGCCERCEIYGSSCQGCP
jgi:hypothetical protein